MDVVEPDRTGLTVRWRDARLLAVDKPAGLLVHPTALDAHAGDSVLARLRAAGEGAWRPVHRLDKGTSGLLLAADAAAARQLGEALAAGGAHKRYLALVRGWPPEAGVVDHPLARDPERPSAGQPHRDARTRFARLACFEWPFAVDARHPASRYALVAAWPETGRRHQVRRHFKHIGHPVIGDATHGKGAHNRAVAAYLGVARLWLHAVELRVPHPDDGRITTIVAPPGPEWGRLGAAAAPAA